MDLFTLILKYSKQYSRQIAAVDPHGAHIGILKIREIDRIFLGVKAFLCVNTAYSVRFENYTNFGVRSESYYVNQYLKEFKMHSAETVSERKSEVKRENRDLCKTKNVIKR